MGKSFMFTSIPVIDFAPFTHGNSTEKQKVVNEIYTACTEVGFMYLQCAIPQSLVDRLFTQVKQFFALPICVKEQVARSPQTNCGYIGLEQERLNPQNPGDLKEALNVGVNSVWLPGQEEFRACVSEFYQLCTTEMAPNILRALAIALHQDENFFDDKHGENYFLRMLHYPSVSQTPKSGQLRAGEHTDYGSITLLLQETGGLEVCTRQGEWIEAKPIPGTILVNIGDAMQRWTNDRLSSTPHRVVVPSGADALRSRYSIALFCDPNSDVELACLPSCQTDYPARYEPILLRDYLASRLAATY